MSPNSSHGSMSFTLPPDLVTYLSEIDKFIATKILPLQASNDNERFFDHRRERKYISERLFFCSFQWRIQRPANAKIFLSQIMHR